MTEAVRKNIYWVTGILLTVFCVVIGEGMLIVTTKVFGVVKATFLRVLFTIPLSWLVIYLATRYGRSPYFQAWLEKKKAGLSDRARAIVKGGEVLAIANAAIFLGPIIASILMLMIGLAARRVYFYAVLCALLCAWVWCLVYSGVLWGLGKVF
jgi:hypothetical protein